MIRGSVALVVALCALLAACGHASPNPGANSSALKSSGPQAKSSEEIGTDMVAAVSASGASTTPIGMRFRIAERPVVGTPLQIAVAFIPAPNVAINHIHAEFQAGDGVQLMSDRTLDITDPSSGVAFEQQLTIVPQQAGVLSVLATVLVDMDSGTIARTYTIPLIAVDGAS